LEGNVIEETKDGKSQAECSPPQSAVTGTAVFRDGKLDPGTVFTDGNGRLWQPAAGSNHYAAFEPNATGGVVDFAKGDENEYDITPSIYFRSKDPNTQQASLLMTLTNTPGVGKVHGRDDNGHLVNETVDGKEEAE